MNQGFLYSLCWLCHQPLSIHLKEHVSVRLPPVPTLLVAIPYADFAYVIEARVLEGKFLFTLRCWRLGKVGHKALWGDFFSFSFFFLLQAIESITMIYRDMLKVNYVVNACPLGQLRITGKKCKKFEIPNSKG